MNVNCDVNFAVQSKNHQTIDAKFPTAAEILIAAIASAAASLTPVVHLLPRSAESPAYLPPDLDQPVPTIALFLAGRWRVRRSALCAFEDH
jgi:hypothetical protein